jgi:short-subunit dehydrogenase
MSVKTILITGASSGIGLALAKQCRSLGHQVLVTARKPADIKRLTEQGFIAFALDVTSASEISTLFAEISHTYTGIDLLINNAGYGAMGPVLDASADVWQQQFATNVFAISAVSRAALPLLQQSQGVIANVGSVSAVVSTPFGGVYCASKAAVHAMTDAMRMELHPLGVQVVLIQPGAIATGFADTASSGLQHWLAANSPWQRFAAGIAARARASADNPTSAESFAKQVLSQLLMTRPPALIAAGNGSKSLVWLKRLLPQSLLDYILQRRFGLRG